MEQMDESKTLSVPSILQEICRELKEIRRLLEKDQGTKVKTKDAIKRAINQLMSQIQ